MKKKKASKNRMLRIRERQINTLNWALESLKKQIVEQNRTIRRLGSNEALEFLTSEEARYLEAETTVKGEAYGNYVTLCDGLDKETVEKCERELAVSLVKQMMDMNAIQFIVKDYGGVSKDPLNRFNTVAAKIWVIPWHKMVKERDGADDKLRGMAEGRDHAAGDHAAGRGGEDGKDGSAHQQDHSRDGDSELGDDQHDCGGDGVRD